MDSFDNSVEAIPVDAGLLPPPPRPIRIVRDGILGFIVAVALTLSLVVVIIVAAILSGQMKMETSQTFSPPPVIWVVLLIGNQIPFLGVALFLRWRYKSTGRILPALFEGPYVSAILIGIVSGLAMAGFGIVHALIATALFGKASTDAMEDLMRTLLAAAGDPLILSGLVLSIAVLAPFCEELFFRGAIFSTARSAENARAAAIVSSVLFAVAHVNPMMFTYYLVFGFTMCWLASKTRTIAAPIAAHITVNATATIAMLLGSNT